MCCLRVKEVSHFKLRSGKSFEGYKEGLDIDTFSNNLKGGNLRVGFGIISNGGLVLKIGLAER